jgi:hypothetical protein
MCIYLNFVSIAYFISLLIGHTLSIMSNMYIGKYKIIYKIISISVINIICLFIIINIYNWSINEPVNI